MGWPADILYGSGEALKLLRHRGNSLGNNRLDDDQSYAKAACPPSERPQFTILLYSSHSENPCQVRARLPFVLYLTGYWMIQGDYWIWMTPSPALDRICPTRSTTF